MQSHRTLGAFAVAASFIPSLIGLAASAMLAVDYRNPVPVFCAEGTGCDALKHTPFAALFGVPTPLFGIVGFVATGVASLLPGRTARVGQTVLSGVAAATGIVLASAQVVLGHFCVYCSIADASGVACGAASAWRWVKARSAAAPPPALACVGALALAAAGVLPFVTGSKKPGVPGVIRAEMAGTPAGEVTIVDFVDFECPFCRMTHAALRPVLDEYRGRVRIVRRQVPLRMHAHALDAARSACCGDMLGKGDAMADALFAAPVGDLTPAGCEEIAARIGLSLESFRACIVDPRTDASIEADRAEFKAAGGVALPTLWIDGESLVGAQRSDVLERMIARALARTGG